MSEGLSELLVGSVVFGLRTFALVYDIATRPLFILFAILRAPVKKQKRPFAYSVSGLGEGPWRSVDVANNAPLVTCAFPGVGTLYESWQKSAKLNAHRRCFGTRPVLAEINDTDAQTGKPIRKVKLGAYEWTTYAEVAAKVDRLGRALTKCAGIRPGSHVAFYCETRAEWMYLALAALRERAVIVTMYATLSREALNLAVQESKPCCIVTTTELLDATLSRLTLPSTLKSIVTVNERADGVKTIGAAKVISMNELLAVDLGNEPEAVTSVSEKDAAMIMYTSGTTGRAKGVVLTHENVLASVAAGIQRVGKATMRPGATFLAYLPLAHVLEFACELAVLYNGLEVGFGSPQTLTHISPRIYDCQGDLVALRPTLMPAVPIILERLAKGIREKMGLRCDLQALVTGSSNRDSSTSERVSKLEGKSKKVGFAALLKARIFELIAAERIAAFERGSASPLLDVLVCRKLAASLGGRLELMMVGGAPLNRATQTVVAALFRVQVAAAYGLTETTAGACMCPAEVTVEEHGTVGPPLACCELLLRSWTEAGYTDDRLKARVDDASHSTWLCPRGELLVYGPNVFHHYFANEEESKRVFVDLDGKQWFTTGDIVEVLADGTFRVVDRRKDCFKLANGEYIAPGRIEGALLASSFVESICVVGNSTRNYLVALVVPKRAALLKLARDLGILSQTDNNADATWQTVCKNENVCKAVLEDFSQVGRKLGLPRIEVPARIHICTEIWSPENGLLTDSLKLRRRNIESHYRSVIELLYASEVM